MRLDRILSEGEAINALRRMGFQLRDSPNRRGLYEVTRSGGDGVRTFTVEQLCSFAEGATAVESHPEEKIAAVDIPFSRVLSEADAVDTLRQMGFELREPPNRRGLYEVTHAGGGGARTFTVEQLCGFASGAAVASRPRDTATPRL